ncbi:MAG TPA: hypothetical protein VHG09_14170, partial [Longimicrobiales bacterium]|nr:hypothetical protein [Longimicrobiales bacterium]
MRVFRAIAAAVAVLSVTAAGAGAQSFAGGDISTARAGFGLSLALGENELLVGEPNNSSRPGEIHIFRPGPSGWERAGGLTAPDAEPSDGFGQKLFLSGNTLFVGVPSAEGNRGTVHVFERAGDGWSHSGELTGDDLEGVNRFGTAIAATGEFAFVSAPVQNQAAGAVYVFRRSAAGWTQAGKLTTDSAAVQPLFGNALAAADGTLFVSAPGVNENRGQVTIFSQDAATGEWTSAGMLPTPEVDANSRFGWAMTHADGTLIVSAPAANDETGAAYAFRQSDGAWTQQAQLSPPSPAPNTVFGIQLASDG